MRTASDSGSRDDVIVVGGGHNGLVAAALLAQDGRTVTVLERSDRVGGAAVSERPWEGVDARVSRYAYLVSLFPHALARRLGIDLRLARRRIASYTPDDGRGLLVVADDDRRTEASMTALTGDPTAFGSWSAFYRDAACMARVVFPTLTEPLPTREELRARLGDDALWHSLVELPLGETLERRLGDDLVRGVVFTDALIGTFAGAHDATLGQNRCFLYHVIGNGTGAWDLPIGGMGAITDALAGAARRAGARLLTGVDVVSVEADGREAEAVDADGRRYSGRVLLAGVVPSVLERLRGRSPAGPDAQGAQLKLNMLLRRLPRLRDPQVTPEEAFAGTLHVNERYSQLENAYRAASSGRLPEPLPLETYCHSLSDDSILGSELRESGAHTLTVFALQTPADLYTGGDDARARATDAALRSLDGVLDEPIEPLLHETADGVPCLEAKTPLDLERELALPRGNIFHGDLDWPWAQGDEEAGRWGVETDVDNLFVCGAGARRGGGVSGVPGHNAARAALRCHALQRR